MKIFLSKSKPIFTALNFLFLACSPIAEQATALPSDDILAGRRLSGISDQTITPKRPITPSETNNNLRSKVGLPTLPPIDTHAGTSRGNATRKRPPSVEQPDAQDRKEARAELDRLFAVLEEGGAPVKDKEIGASLVAQILVLAKSDVSSVSRLFALLRNSSRPETQVAALKTLTLLNESLGKDRPEDLSATELAETSLDLLLTPNSDASLRLAILQKLSFYMVLVARQLTKQNPLPEPVGESRWLWTGPYRNSKMGYLYNPDSIVLKKALSKLAAEDKDPEIREIAAGLSEMLQLIKKLSSVNSFRKDSLH